MRWLAITRLTLTELRHGKLVVLPLTMVVALLLVAANVQDPNAYGTAFVEGIWGSLAVVGALVAILAASSAISSEIERGTMLLLAARPVSRLTILAGKVTGIALYLLACATAWALALAFGLGTQLDIGMWATFTGAMLAYAPMLLAALLAITCSTWFPTRGAIGASLAIWFAALIVAAIPLETVRPSNVERVELAQGVLGWALPAERLGQLRDIALSVQPPASSYAALLVIGAWFLVAAALLQLRGSIAR